MLLKLKLPEQEHGSHKNLDYLEIDSETSVVASVVGVEKSKHNTRYHLGIQKLICTSYPNNFESIILKQLNSTKTWTLEVEFKTENRDGDSLCKSHSLKVLSVKTVNSFEDID
jgi:hypothetical protein